MDTKHLAHLETEACDVDLLQETESLYEGFFGWLTTKHLFTAIVGMVKVLKG